MRRGKICVWSGLILAAVLAFSGCGAGSGASKMMVAETAAAAAGYSMTRAETTASMDMAAAEEAFEFEVDSGRGLSAENGILKVNAAGRKLIRNVNLSVETDSFDELIAALNAKISELGGYAERSEVSGSSLNYRREPILRYASISARIPSDKLDSFVTAVENSGNVINKSESTTDVTLQYSDVESRKKSLEIEQERIWALLEKADSLEAVISLEERLSDIRYQLESMESQLRLYDNQVEYSTVELYINEVKIYTEAAPETPVDKIKSGFADNLTALGTAVTDLIIGILAGSPIWVPIAVIAWIVWIFVQRRIKKAKAKNNDTNSKTSGLKWFRKEKDSQINDKETKN